MNALPGRCSSCSARVFWIGAAWRDSPTAKHGGGHKCSVSSGTLVVNKGPGDAQTSPAQANPECSELTVSKTSAVT